METHQRPNGTTLTISDNWVKKQFPPEYQYMLGREVFAYTNLSEFTPALLEIGPDFIVIERLTPVLEMDESAHCRDQLVGLLKKLHARGFAHCDVTLENTVFHPDRGILLIDWSALQPATTEFSRDLYGASKARASIDSVPAAQWPDGVWFNGPHPTCPGPYWGRPFEAD